MFPNYYLITGATSLGTTVDLIIVWGVPGGINTCEVPSTTLEVFYYYYYYIGPPTTTRLNVGNLFLISSGTFC